MNSLCSLGSVFAKYTTALTLVVACMIVAQAQPTSPSGRNNTQSSELSAARMFESMRKSPPQQLAFLLRMPKGGDLHSHLSGSVYAERYIEWGAEKGLCVNQASMVLSEGTCDPKANQVAVSTALTNPVLYRNMVNAWSMRFWQFSGQNGHDQFFDAFLKFSVGTYGRTGRMLADAVSRAARGRVSYLELMLTPDGGLASQIGGTVAWDGNFEEMFVKMKSAGITKAVTAGANAIRDAETEMRGILKCGTSEADPGCDVTIRYISQVSRGSGLNVVYAQMITGLQLASDPTSKVVAVNLVQAEDGLAALQNFRLHMQMLKYLKQIYVKAHITLHAGELAPGGVPPDEMTFHIRESVMTANAERIGHGVDIMHEDNPYELLKEMERRKILIEICLSSNDLILGVSKDQHPLATYMQYGVPVALATDDEGVSRSEISREFLKAAEEQGLGYIQLKTMARNSLQYAFLPGEGLWSDVQRSIPVAACSEDLTVMSLVSSGCKTLTESSEKARLQWKLEEDFKAFEKDY
jgi:adenosine deaminase